MKKFKATYLIKGTNKEYTCDVFAMSKKQAFEMYQLSFAILVGLDDCGLVED